MGLIPSLLNYARQSEQDEMRKRMFEAEMADRAESRNMAMQREKEAREQEQEYLSGVSKMMDLKMDASQKKMQAMTMQQRADQAFRSGDPSAAMMLSQAEALFEASSMAEQALPIIKKTVFMNTLRSNKQVQNALAASIANDLGVNPKDMAPSTVKVKFKRGGGVAGEPEEEYTYDAPADSLNAILPQGAARPVSRQSGPSLDEQLGLNRLYQSSLGTGVSTMSTGEQPVDSSMLFGGGQVQPQPQAQSQANTRIKKRIKVGVLKSVSK